MAKTTKEIREVLSTQIDDLIEDKISPQKLMAISNACGRMIQSWALEVTVYRLSGMKPNLKAMGLLPEKN